MFSALNSKNYKLLLLMATIFNQDALGFFLYRNGLSIPSQGENMLKPSCWMCLKRLDPKIPWRIILLSVSVLESPFRGYTCGTSILHFWTTPHGMYLDYIQSNIQNIRMNILWGTYNYYGQISNNDQPSASINTPQRKQQKWPFCRI